MRAVSSKVPPQALAPYLHNGVKRPSALVAVVRLKHHDGHWEVQINGRHSPWPQEAGRDEKVLSEINNSTTGKCAEERKSS